jgi:hypothetical protein
MAAGAARHPLCTEDPVLHAAQRIGCSTAITDDDPAMAHGCQPTSFIRMAAASMLALALTGAANAQLLDCLGGQRPTQVAELIFGRNIGSRIGVSEGEFGRFVDREIISRFPSGLTVFNAAGQWRDQASNKIVREPSKIVQIVLPGRVDDVARLNEIVEAYKTRFKQHSVGMIVRPACVSF